MSSNVKNSLFLILEKVVLLGLSFFNSVLLARIAGPTFFGDFSYIISFAGLFSPLCIMGLNNVVTKYVVKHPKNSHYYIKSALRIRLLGACFSVLVTTLICLHFLDIANEQSKLIILLVAMQGFTFLYVLEFFYIAKKQVTTLVRVRLIIITFINVAKLVAILNSASLQGLVLLQGLESVFIGCCYYFIYISQGHHKEIKRKVRLSSHLALYKKGQWLLFSGIAAALYLKVDQIMLAQLVNTETVAYYAAAAKLSEFWYVFPVLIANVYTAQLSHTRFKAYHAYEVTLQQLIVVLTLIALTLSIFLWFFSKQLITLIYGESYRASAAILSIHIFASVFIFQRAVLSKWLIIEKLYKYSLVSNVAGAVINVLLNLVLIPKYHGIGAAWATLISYMVASYGFLFINNKTRSYAKILHQSMLNSPFILIKLAQNLKVHYEKHYKKTN